MNLGHLTYSQNTVTWEFPKIATDKERAVIEHACKDFGYLANSNGNRNRELEFRGLSTEIWQASTNEKAHELAEELWNVMDNLRTRLLREKYSFRTAELDAAERIRLEKNEAQIEEIGYGDDSFEFEGVSISNPYLDSSGMVTVENPVEYYGKNYITWYSRGNNDV